MKIHDHFKEMMRIAAIVPLCLLALPGGGCASNRADTAQPGGSDSSGYPTGSSGSSGMTDSTGLDNTRVRRRHRVRHAERRRGHQRRHGRRRQHELR